MLADTRPIRRPRRATGLPGQHLLRPLLVGTWPLAAGVGLTAFAVILDVASASPGSGELGAAPRLFAERFFPLPFTPHSNPTVLGGGPLLTFVAVLVAAFASGRTSGREAPGRRSAATVLVTTIPFSIACLLIALADPWDAPHGIVLALLRPIVPSLWVIAAAIAGASLSWVAARRRRHPVAIARGVAAGAFAAAAAVLALALISLLAEIAPALGLLVAGRGVRQAWDSAAGHLHDWPGAGATILAMSPTVSGPAIALLLVLVLAGLMAAIFLLPTPVAEVGAFIGTFAGLLWVAALSSAARQPAEAISFLPQHLALLLLPAAIAGLAGPWLAGGTAAAWIAARRPLRSLGDSLPPPVAPPIGPGRPRLMAGWQPPAAVAAAVLAAEVLMVIAGAPPRPVSRPVPAAAVTSPLLVVAQRYLDASARGDGAAAFAEMVVDEPPGDADALHLDDVGALTAMLANPAARADPPTRLRLVSRRDAGRDVAAEFSAGSHGERHPALILRQVGGDWKVVIRAGLAEVGLAQPAALRVDGLALPNRLSYRLIALPGPHQLAAGDGRVQRAESASLQVGSGAIARVQLAPSFTAEAMTSAATAAKSLLEGCAAFSASAPTGCPQSAPVPAPVTWRSVGDPVTTISLRWEGDQSYTATGRYQYIAGYRVHVPEAIAHTAATGAYRLALQWADAGFVAKGGLTQANGQPVARPAADEAALHRAVSSALQECASTSLLRPADCPNGLPSTKFVTPVTWKLLSDPTAQGGVEFDEATGEFSVGGTFRMSASYTEGGQRKNAISAGGYRARLLWDGSAPVLVNLRPA